MSTALPAFTMPASPPPRADAAGVEALARAAMAQLVSLIEAGNGSVTAQVTASAANGLTEMAVKDVAVKLVLSAALPVGQEVEIRMEPPVTGQGPRLVVTPRVATPQMTAPTEPRALQMAAVELALQGGATAPVASRSPPGEAQAAVRAVAAATPPAQPSGDEAPTRALNTPVAAASAKGVATSAQSAPQMVEVPDVPAALPAAPRPAGNVGVADRPATLPGPVPAGPLTSDDLQVVRATLPVPPVMQAATPPSGSQAPGGAVAQRPDLPAAMVSPEGEATGPGRLVETPTVPQLQRIPYPIVRAETRPATSPAAMLAPLTVTDLADPAVLEARQGSVAPLMAHLAQAAQAPETPEAVRDAAWRVLARRLDGNTDGLTGKAVAEALAGAGTLAAEASEAPDIRSALLELRQALFKWIGAAAPRLHAPQAQPLPPMAGDGPRAERALSLDQMPPAPTHDRANGLLGEADGAVSRLKLLQLASNPGEVRPGAANPQPTEIRMEVPLLVGRELGLVQFVLERDARPRQQKKERPWRLRFALNFSATGEVGADIALLGRQTQVALWAVNAETAAALEDMLPELGPALAGKGLDLSAVRVRRGRPVSKAIGPGRMLDGAR